jgi:hypothetical protein
MTRVQKKKNRNSFNVRCRKNLKNKIRNNNFIAEKERKKKGELPGMYFPRLSFSIYGLAMVWQG